MKKILVYLLVICGYVYSQSIDYKVSSFSISDNLGIKSFVDLEIGKYEVYEFSMNEGDRYAFDLSAEGFWPAVFLRSPNGKFTIKYPKHDYQIHHDSVAVESGKYEIYVIGDTTAVGKFELTMWFTDKSSYSLKSDTEFCDALRFYSAHADADFYFLKNRVLRFPGTSAVKFDERKTAVNAELYHSNNVEFLSAKFEELKEEVKDCLGPEWFWTNSEDKTVFSKIGSPKKIELSRSKASDDSLVILLKISS